MSLLDFQILGAQLLAIPYFFTLATLNTSSANWASNSNFLISSSVKCSVGSLCPHASLWHSGYSHPQSEVAVGS